MLEMRRPWTLITALALVGGAATVVAQTAPALTPGAPPVEAAIAAEPNLTLTIAAPTEVIFDATATGADAQLRLEQNGTYIAEDSDSGDGTNARLARFLTPGTYNVIVWEYQYNAMTASVSATTAPAMTPVATIATGAPPTTVVSLEGDYARAASVEVALTVAAAGSFVLTATPTPDPSAVIQCSPEITIIQNNAVVGDVISAPSSGQPATATRPLAAGTYTLRMRSWWNHACTMTLTVNPA
jgi:hypothetical protein